MTLAGFFRVALAAAVLPALLPSAAAGADRTAGPDRFAVTFEAGAVTSLKAAGDALATEYIEPGRRLGHVSLRFRRPGGDWRRADTAALAGTAATSTANPGAGSGVRYQVDEGFAVRIGFEVRPDALAWEILLENESPQPLEIGDLALPLPMNTSYRKQTPAVLKHSFVSGHGSFWYWLRPDSAPPWLVFTPAGGTHFEFWEAQPEYRVFIHSVAAGAEAVARGTRWRQPHTGVTLAPSGQPGASRSYGGTFRWAESRDEVRRILVEEGGIDAQVVPGMTVPSDLAARFALRCEAPIHAVTAEFPDQTRIEPLGGNGSHRIYQVKFGRLGENRLEISYGDGRRMFLEFFATEPLETLIRKRAAFIARRQHRDPRKWYDGLFGEWNMESRVLLGPDNYDRIAGWRIYAVTCDDPGLSKPAFLAAKNAVLPEQAEVAALDYYLERFVWGGLQRTTEETHPYGIYGIPDWKTNRESSDPGPKGRLHIWRIYDYPHVVLIYLGMARVARDHPQIRTALRPADYLRRAWGTAMAMFTVPLRVEGWSAYGTGLYNEVVIVDLIDELEAAGMAAEARQLREHWERKVRFFVKEKPDLFRSEYAFDSTGFESTHAIASYAMRHAATGAGSRLGVDPAEARRFMERQLAANLFCRGTIEPAYYYLGSDYRGPAGDAYTLSYMSPMGGWAVLDYALHHAADPAPFLRLGYASCLSSWALMNSGTAATNYGFWYPGPDNDGAAGGGFEPAPFGRTWLGQPHHRGAWYYACETDLGYCAALRSAATVVADDPIFGRFCFGGDLRPGAGVIEVVPRDGLRQRFHAVLDNGRVGLAIGPARFAAGKPITLRPDLSGVEFVVESDNPAPHPVTVGLTGFGPGPHAVTVDGRPRAFVATDRVPAALLEIPAVASGQRIALRRSTGTPAAPVEPQPALPAGPPPDKPPPPDRPACSVHAPASPNHEEMKGHADPAGSHTGAQPIGARPPAPCGWRGPAATTENGLPLNACPPRYES